MPCRFALQGDAVRVQSLHRGPQGAAAIAAVRGPDRGLRVRLPPGDPGVQGDQDSILPEPISSGGGGGGPPAASGPAHAVGGPGPDARGEDPSLAEPGPGAVPDRQEVVGHGGRREAALGRGAAEVPDVPAAGVLRPGGRAVPGGAEARGGLHRAVQLPADGPEGVPRGRNLLQLREAGDLGDEDVQCEGVVGEGARHRVVHAQGAQAEREPDAVQEQGRQGVEGRVRAGQRGDTAGV